MLDWLAVLLLIDPNDSVLETAPLGKLFAQLPQQIALAHAGTSGEMRQLMLVDQSMEGGQLAFAVEGRACVGIVARYRLAVPRNRVDSFQHSGFEADLI